MYSPKPGNWPSKHLYLKTKTGFHAIENLSEEAISKAFITDKFAIKLLVE